jgi:hypothetical protein
MKFQQLRVEQNSRNGMGQVDMDIGSDVDVEPEDRPTFDEGSPETTPPEKDDPLGGSKFRDFIASK